MEPMPLPDQERLFPYVNAWAELCTHIQCILAGGALYDGYAEASRGSIAAIEALIAIATNLRPSLLYSEPKPWTVGYGMLGDAPNHIRPELRSVSTRHY